MKKNLFLSLLLSAVAVNAAAGADIKVPQVGIKSSPQTACRSQDDWSEATFARHIYGNTWYVGTCGISVILIATPKGHILIDGATAEAAPSIENSIKSLGVKLSDIKYILTTHEHHDHIGGVAKLQADTGATVIARSAAVKPLRTGKSDPHDPQHHDLSPFAPIANVKSIPDAGRITLGNQRVQNIPMTGHTPGGSGWTWRECENNVCYNIVFSDSLGSISDKVYRFSNEHSIAKDLIASTKRLENTACDLLITGHGTQSDLLDRLDGKIALTNTKACAELANFGRENLQKRIEEEKAGKTF